jgi:hypothetical protein
MRQSAGAVRSESSPGGQRGFSHPPPLSCFVLADLSVQDPSGVHRDEFADVFAADAGFRGTVIDRLTGRPEFRRTAKVHAARVSIGPRFRRRSSVRTTVRQIQNRVEEAGKPPFNVWPQ